MIPDYNAKVKSQDINADLNANIVGGSGSGPGGDGPPDGPGSGSTSLAAPDELSTNGHVGGALRQTGGGFGQSARGHVSSLMDRKGCPLNLPTNHIGNCDDCGYRTSIRPCPKCGHNGKLLLGT